MRTNRDPLVQLRNSPDAVTQFRLADQDNLQQLAFAGFQIGQQAQLLQHVRRQVLRLIDHQHVIHRARGYELSRRRQGIHPTGTTRRDLECATFSA